ncbi:methyltransferase domain-containing protein [Aureibaculum algae]|uniref:Methyltransferase domain-containing protein n=1 Tax=Aureibaculum algae TaxID=2584122 RepID=A0A5B7TY36_9FLAO|nr:class I SAM-dependent methyltransferase [Aureibaculum algae]QCX39697.1 methyltransferase domain-containing protein [Aureibaculum algae]
MREEQLKMWDDRFANQEYTYGVQPNAYLKEQLEKLNPGKILFPAEGEGRNAVYAAKLGFDVSAFDLSKEGRKKALKLADENNVTIDYQIGELPSLDYHKEQFDVIALVFAHFNADIRADYHKILNSCIRKGGLLIIEAFSKKHLEYRTKNPKVGGPRDLETLCSIEEFKTDFKNFEIIELEEKEVELNEGLFHVGTGSVIRFVGRKK